VSSEPGGLATGVLLMRCPGCGNDLHGLPSDCIFLCTSCGTCLVVGETMTRVPVEFSRSAGDSLFLPFWKVEATVSIPRRVSRPPESMSTVEGPRLFDGSERRLTEVSIPPARCRIVFPAFATDQALRAGVALQDAPLRAEPPEAGSIPPVVGGSIGLEDVDPLARGVAVGVQVAARDRLAMMEVDLTVHSATVLALGCRIEKSFLLFAGGALTMPIASVTDLEAVRTHLRSPGGRV